MGTAGAKRKVRLEPSFERLTNAVYTSMREVEMSQQQTTSQKGSDNTAAFRKSFWGKEKKNSNKVQKASKTFMAEFFETLFAELKL